MVVQTTTCLIVAENSGGTVFDSNDKMHRMKR